MRITHISCFKINVLYSALFLMGITACQPNISDSKKSNDSKICVTDFRGVTVTLDKPATRIVCLIESALSGLYMLNVSDNVVGISSNVYTDNTAPQYAALDDRIKNKILPAPGNWDFVNQESVIALRPDLVIMWASQTESISALESKGIPVYAVMLHSIDDIYKEMRDLGTLTGSSERADELVNYTKQHLEDIATNTSDRADKKKIYFMWAQGPLSTSGKKSTVNELIQLAGGINVCDAEEEHLVVNLERIIEWNPDMIVMWYNEQKDPEDIMKLSGWQNIKAIREGQVYELPSVFFCDLWTLKFRYAVKLLALWAYPELAGVFDIHEEQKQMLINLYGEKGEKLL